MKSGNEERCEVDKGHGRGGDVTETESEVRRRIQNLESN